jgi:hypothetical protein
MLFCLGCISIGVCEGHLLSSDLQHDYLECFIGVPIDESLWVHRSDAYLRICISTTLDKFYALIFTSLLSVDRA